MNEPPVNDFVLLPRQRADRRWADVQAAADVAKVRQVAGIARQSGRAGLASSLDAFAESLNEQRASMSTLDARRCR